MELGWLGDAIWMFLALFAGFLAGYAIGANRQ